MIARVKGTHMPGLRSKCKLPASTLRSSSNSSSCFFANSCCGCRNETLAARRRIL